MNRKSVGFRLAAWYLAVLLTAMLLCGVGSWFALRRALWNHQQETLAGRAEAIHQFLEQEARAATPEALQEETREYGSALPAGQGMRVTTDSGKIMFQHGFSEDADVIRTSTTIMAKGHPLLVELSAPTQPLYETLDLLRNVLLGMLPVVLLVAGIGGWWLSRRALQPVDDMTAAAETLSIDDVSARLVVPATGDELQRLGDAWNRMLDRISQSVARMNRFTMDAAHELRTPAAIIQSSAELALRRQRGADEYRVVVQSMAEESKRLSTLVEDLLLLARSDADVRRPPEQLDAIDVVSRAVQAAAPLAEVKHQSIALQVEARVGDVHATASIRGDSGALHRLVLILLDNAIKFSPEGTKIQVSISNSGENIELEVADEGPGISAVDLPYIFQRFYRSSTARNGPGAGLGLAIAKSIVDEHSGEIDVFAGPQRGAIVRIKFPSY